MIIKITDKNSKLLTKDKVLRDNIDIALDDTSSENLVSENIKQGITILGVEGSVVASDGIDYIKAWAGGDTNLGNPIDLYSESVLEVGAQSFYESPNIRIVNFPNCIKVNESFKYSSVKELYLTSLENMAPTVCYECKSLEKVDIRNATTIGYDCFRYCSSLKEINVENVESISNFAFASCKSLENLTFPKLNSFSNYIFYSCDNLKTIRFEGFISSTRFGNNTFKDCINLTDVYVNYEGVVPMSYATTWDGAGTTQGYINYHVKPNLDLATQYASATNWSALITAGTIIIVEDYTDD